MSSDQSDNEFKLLPPPMKGSHKASENMPLRPGTIETAKLGKKYKTTKEYKTEKAQKRAKKVNLKKVGVVDTSVLKYVPTKFEDDAKVTGNVLFKPHPGPQTEFLQSNEDEVLFSGGRGSGKSIALIVDPLRYVTNKNFKALVIRRTMPELRELIGRAKDIYIQAVPGCKWKDQEKIFTFPSGATIEFGYCDNIDDAERYRGQEYTWIGLDEVSQHPSEDIMHKLKGSLRTKDPSLRTFLRATCNPTGVGRQWVKEYWIDRGAAGETIVELHEVGKVRFKATKKWLHSNVYDNPTLIDNNPQYVAMLASLPDAMRKQWLDGNWEAVEGMAFPEFSKEHHIIPAFKIPQNWVKFRSADWGYSSKAAVMWMAIDQDNNIYVYREYVTNGNAKDEYGRPKQKVVASEFAKRVLEIECDDAISYGVLDTSCWADRGTFGPSIAEEMILQRCYWRPSDSSSGSRKAGKNRLHELLKLDPDTNKPKLFVFDTCKELIKCLYSLPLDKNNSEDVDTDADDHAYDALRYGVMSRPHGTLNYADLLKRSGQDRPVVINSVFGA